MPFRFERQELPEVILIEPRVFGDERGFFLELHKRSEFIEGGIDTVFVQDSISGSSRDTVRGLHYQASPSPQGKLVTAIEGEIFDVAVDVRFGSPTCGRWVSRVLTSSGREMLYIPEGFAHGFCVLSDFAQVLYKFSAEYDPATEVGVAWDDPSIGISWPIKEPTLSDRDSQNPGLQEVPESMRFRWVGP